MLSFENRRATGTFSTMTRRIHRASPVPFLGIGLLVVSSALLPLAEASPPTILDPTLLGGLPVAALELFPEPLTAVALANLAIGGAFGLRARRKLLVHSGLG